MFLFLQKKDYHEEHALQAFKSFDKNNNGYILPSHFQSILINLKNHLLSPYVKENLANVNIKHKKFTRFIHLFILGSFIDMLLFVILR